MPAAVRSDDRPLAPFSAPNLPQAGDHSSPTGRLLYEVTRFARLRNGPNSIDRVTLRLLESIQANGRKACPVAFDGKTWRRVALADGAHEDWTDRPLVSEWLDPLEAVPGDRLLNVTLDMRLPSQAFSELQLLRSHGLWIDLLLHDILPVSHPEWHPPGEILNFDLWIRRMLAVVDRICCTTHHVAGLLRNWITLISGSSIVQPPTRAVPVIVSPLGCDPFGSEPVTESARPPGTARRLAWLEGSAFKLPASTAPSFLTVAAIHPRKGIDTLIDAFDSVWQSGADVRLLITGRPLADPLVKRLQSHPEFGRRLLYPGYLDDTRLREAAAACTAQIVPSREEGFGLPVVEASAFGLPVIARDIPVFREIAGDQCLYFSNQPGVTLADRILQWMTMTDSQRSNFLTHEAAIGWQEAGARLLNRLDDTRADLVLQVPRARVKRPA